MHPLVLVTGVWLAQAPASTSGRPAETPLEVTQAPTSPDLAPSGTAAPPKEGQPAGEFFGGHTMSAAAPGGAKLGPSAPPPMPPIEELPPRPGKPSGGGLKLQLGGAKDRKPIAGGGAGFFDPGKLGDEATGGGSVQVRGYLGFNFAVTQRTDISMRNPETGTFDKLKTLPYFGGGAANLYVGAPIYADVVYVRVAFEFVSIPRAQPGSADVSPAFNPVILMESAALEVNPFAWASKSPRWFSEGFKITGGVFVVPFGIEDEEHDAPVRWWATRPLAMSAGRIYPGTWIDIGAMIKWKPSFGHRRPIELDVGILNGDACTQTRSNDLLYRYQPVGEVDQVCEHQLRGVEKVNRADGSVLGIAPDNNGNKSVMARVQVRPVPALNLGGSFVWGRHPTSQVEIANFLGKTFVDLAQAPTWRAGAHLDLNFDEVFQSSYPLPHLRGEVIYGIDAAAPPVDPKNPVVSDRRMLGGYFQVAQPLWRRKKTRLHGLILQYRFDHADPDLAIPARHGKGVVNPDFADEYRYDEAMQAHVVGLRFPVLPRFTLKAEYAFVREGGGRANQLYNDNFSFQAVADF